MNHYLYYYWLAVAELLLLPLREYLAKMSSLRRKLFRGKFASAAAQANAVVESHDHFNLEMI